jgi:hypothetical protein
MDEERFKTTYPAIGNFLDSVIRPDVDGDNLLEMLHRVMRHGHPEATKNLVEEFKRLAEDRSFGAKELARIFNEDVMKPHRIIRKGNARAMLRTLSEYMIYLYDVEEVRGSSKWVS